MVAKTNKEASGNMVSLLILPVDPSDARDRIYPTGVDLELETRPATAGLFKGRKRGRRRRSLTVSRFAYSIRRSAVIAPPA